MRATGGVILDDSALKARYEQLKTLQDLFEQQRGKLENLQKELRKAVDSYKGQANSLLHRERELEKEYAAKELERIKEYAKGVHTNNKQEKDSLLVIQGLVDSVREQLERVNKLETDFIAGHAERSRQLEGEFESRVQQLRAELDAAYGKLAEKKAALHAWEQELTDKARKLEEKEEDIRSGHVQEEHEAQMKIERDRQKEKWDDIKREYERIGEENATLVQRKAAIANELAVLEQRRVEAQKDFATQRADYFSGVEAHVDDCLNKLKEAQNRDATERCTALAAFQQLLTDERRREEEAFSAVLAERRETEEKAWTARREQLQQQIDEQAKKEATLREKEASLVRREESLQRRERELQSQRECIEHQLMVDEEKYSAMARTSVRAAEEKARAAEEARESLLAELATTRVQLDAMKLMSARYGDKTIDQIDNQIRLLEQENAALKTENYRLQAASGA